MERTGIVFASSDAGWSSLVARRAHNPKVVGSNPAPATNTTKICIGLIESGNVLQNGQCAHFLFVGVLCRSHLISWIHY